MSTISFQVDVDAKKTVASWSHPDYLVSEPVFVARDSDNDGDEDDGVVLSLLTKKTVLNYAGLLILNAKTLEEIARVDFETKGSVTATLHGLFNPNKDASKGVFA